MYPTQDPSRPIKPWWERCPGRLETELAWLRYFGIRAEVGVDRLAAGRIGLDIEYAVRGRTLHLRARFPYSYPYARFELVAPEVEVRAGESCGRDLVGVGCRHPWSMRDTVAKFLVEEFPRLLEPAP